MKRNGLQDVQLVALNVQAVVRILQNCFFAPPPACGQSYKHFTLVIYDSRGVL